MSTTTAPPGGLSPERRFLFCSAAPCVNHDAEYGLAVGYKVFVSPVISSAGRGLHVRTERRLVPPRWAVLFVGA